MIDEDLANDVLTWLGFDATSGDWRGAISRHMTKKTVQRLNESEEWKQVRISDEELPQNQSGINFDLNETRRTNWDVDELQHSRTEDPGTLFAALQQIANWSKDRI